LLNHRGILGHVSAFFHERSELDKAADTLASHVLKFDNIQFPRTSNGQV
jgi:hypothetical protein